MSAINLTDEMVVAAMAKIPGCDHDAMVDALEAALAIASPQTERLIAALREAERFLDYFAEGRREFVGPGTPKSCLAHIRWALGKDAAPLDAPGLVSA